MPLSPFSPNLRGCAYYHFAVLPSAREYLLQHPSLPYPLICITQQDENQGREIAVRCRFSHSAESNAGLQQKAALSLAKVGTFRLCWPADLYAHEEKIATIILDTMPDSAHSCEVILSVAFRTTDKIKGEIAALNTLLSEWLSMLSSWQEKPYLSVEETEQWSDYEVCLKSDSRGLGIDQKGRQIRFENNILTFLPSP